jgi:hypothetical protein
MVQVHLVHLVQVHPYWIVHQEIALVVFSLQGDQLLEVPFAVSLGEPF